MDRPTKLCFLLLTCPLLACSDDLPEVPEPMTTDGGSTTDPATTITPTTMPDPETDTDPDPDTTSADSDSTSGDPNTTSSTTDEPATSSSSGEEMTSSTGRVCGDDVIDMDEDCDGMELGGMDCAGLGMGFSGGTLACADDCTFDTAGCFECGNDIIEGAEACDGMDLGGNTCETEGFVDGTIACAGDCTLDTSMCNSCGDDIADMGEDCDGMDLGGNTCAGLGMGFTGGTLACDGMCGFDTAGCTNVPWPVAGEVIITEIMQNPMTLLDAEGEFFEVYNPAMGASYQLGGCMVEGATDVGFTIAMDMVIGPQEYRTFAIDSMGGPGFVPDYFWPIGDYNLSNSSDEVRLVCNMVVVDEVIYDNGATFPDPNGQSMNLDPMAYDAVANDDGTNWCEGSSSYNGDFGTPGADNTVCMGMVDYPIDFCRLQFPDVIDEPEGTDVDVFGRLFIAGLTDLSGVNDPAPSVIGYVGYGPDGTDPAVDPGWVWNAGVPNAVYGPASPGYEANNDEYQALLSVPSPPGAYDFAFRFSGDGGTTFTYCDGQPEGSSNGYAPADAGQMTSQAGGPPPVLFFSEYAEGSSSNKAVEIYNANGSDVDLGSCEVRFYFNGNVAPTNTINLAGTLADDDVFVVCDDSINAMVFDPMNCDLLATGTFFNGDDAIELVCGVDTLDVIGEIGFDPGSEWAAGGVGTQNETIRRDCSVVAGDANGADPFDPSVEWASFPQDDFSDFGQYVCP